MRVLDNPLPKQCRNKHMHKLRRKLINRGKEIGLTKHEINRILYSREN
jgi:hypothetical protein